MGVLVQLVSILVGVLLILAFALVAVASAASRRLLRPPRRVSNWTPRDLGLDYEPFAFTTRDGVTLKGWLVKGSREKAVVVIHGYTSSKWDEDYMKPAIEVLGRAGYTVVALDMRAHGESGGDITTLGYRESEDVVDLVSYLRGMGFKKVALYGFSMGGAVSLMAASKTSVDAVVLDSPYVDIRSSGRRWISRVRGPVGALLRLSYPLIILMVSRRAGVPVSKLVMYEYARKVGAPVLLVAPSRDDLISVEEYRSLASRLSEATRALEFWVVDTGHVGAWRSHRAEYEKRLLAFLERSMQGVAGR